MLWKLIQYGFFQGALYALLALGYSLIYGVMRTVNFAHGEILMLGTYAVFYARRTGLGDIGTLFFSLSVCGIAGLCMERFLYRPLRRLPESFTVVGAICLSLFLQNSASLLFSADPKRILPFSSEAILSRYGFLIAPFAAILLAFWLYHTKAGLCVRAVAEDTDAAALSGIPVHKTFAGVFMISGMTAALSSFLYTNAYPAAFPFLGAALGLKAYTASVIGGIGSLPGAVLGGFLLGILETLIKGLIEPISGGRLTAAFADGAVFTLLLFTLLIRPFGLLGKERKEKI